MAQDNVVFLSPYWEEVATLSGQLGTDFELQVRLPGTSGRETQSFWLAASRK